MDGARTSLLNAMIDRKHLTCVVTGPPSALRPTWSQLRSERNQPQKRNERGKRKVTLHDLH